MALTESFFRRYDRPRESCIVDREPTELLRDPATGSTLQYLVYLLTRAPARVRRSARIEAGLEAQPEVESDSSSDDEMPGHFVQFYGHTGGCRHGFCCVYSMWYDPVYVHVGECTHVCSISPGRFPHCGPSLFEDCLPARDFARFARRHARKLGTGGPHGTGVVFSRRRRPQKMAKDGLFDQKSYQIAEVAFTPAASHKRDRVAPVENKVPPPKRERHKRHHTAISRIRKCMGTRAFGRIGKTRT